MDKRAELIALADSLNALMELLDLHATCPWSAHFDRCSGIVSRLLLHGFVQRDLDALSVMVTSVYSGPDSFNDYLPPFCRGETQPDLPDFEIVARQVYDAASSLRVIGHVD